MIINGKVVNFKKKRKYNFLLENKAVIIASIIFIVGLLIAVFTVEKGTKAFNFIFDFFYLNRLNMHFFKVFLLCFSVYFSLLTVIFLCGSSLMGAILIPIIILVLGILFGGISANLYSLYSLKGIAFNAVVIVPPAIFFLITLFFASKSSFYFSLDIVKLTVIKSGAVNISENFKRFCSSYLVYAILIFLVSLSDTILSVLFLKLFNF